MYKVGDEVLIRGEITDVHEGTDNPYFVAHKHGYINWVSEDKIIPMGKTYEMGLFDAWELAKKILYGNNEQLIEIFGLYVKPEFFDLTHKREIINTHTPEEALAKIEAYEKEKEIKVGDVVEDEEGTKALVIDKGTENTYFVFTENGCVEDWYKVDLKKTGKKISIGDLLRQIGE